MYAIIDIETTGGSPVTEKITEIAILVHDGTKIIREFSTLVNPEKDIPHYITNLTGITNEMVADAPKFYEIAKNIVEITEDCIFVAHNVNFDYHFIRSEYKRLGYEYSRNKLCTVQLSRKLIPGFPSYSLGNICNKLNIKIEDRHRALGDAFATVKLFEYLLTINNLSENSRTPLLGLNKKDIHPNLSLSKIETLPESTGVYYFYDDNNELIYIGKSKDIRSRIYSHFNNHSSRKAIEMRLNIADISYEITGSELISLLKESQEIKSLKPKYNRAQRRNITQFGLYTYQDQKGYIRFTICSTKDKEEPPLNIFSSIQNGKKYLQNLIDEYHLCQKLSGLYPSAGACFHYEIAQCYGACIDKEEPSIYNIRASAVVKLHSYSHQSFVIMDKGRTDDELGVILVENSKYKGYGFLSSEFFKGDIINLLACIQKFDDNKDVQQIIKSHLRSNSTIKVIPLPAADLY
jgi:DNA polymerase III subunit epsilon